MSPVLAVAPAPTSAEPAWWVLLPDYWRQSFAAVLAEHHIDTTGWTR